MAIDFLRQLKHHSWLQMLSWKRKRLRAQLEARGNRIGRSSVVDLSVAFPHGGITIGENCFINRGTRIEGSAVIGDGVYIGHETLLLTRSHELGPSTQRAGSVVMEPVHVGEGWWLGARVVVLPGVAVAPGSIIGAGAVVTKSTDPDGLYVGVPARRIRDL